MTWTKNDNEFISEIKSQFRRDGSTGTEAGMDLVYVKERRVNKCLLFQLI